MTAPINAEPTVPLIPDLVDKYYAKNIGTPASRIRLEVGDAKDPAQFYPQFKTLHWDNECNFSVRLLDLDYAAATVAQKPGFIEWASPDRVVRFYETEVSDKHEYGGFEFEVEYAAAPKTNVVQFSITVKGLNFFYQTPLTPEEIKRGAVRPDNVVGSYAAYHATQKHNYIGGKNYATGKAFHLYRPFATDAKGRVVWCDLLIDINSGLLSITIPQDFLDTAAYPVIVDPTYGYTSLGASEDGTDNSAVAYNAGSFGGTNNSVIASAVWYGRRSSGSGNSNVDVGIYHDNAGATSPDTRLDHVSGSLALTSTKTQYTINVAGTFQLQNGTIYWIAAACDLGPGWSNEYDTAGAIDDSFTGGDATLPATWIQGGSSGVPRQYSFYLNLSAGGGGSAGPSEDYWVNSPVVSFDPCNIIFS